MARKLGIDSQAVAYAVIGDLLAELGRDAIGIALDAQDTNGITNHLLEAADVEYLPRARRLTLSFDLSGESPDPDEPIPYVPTDEDRARQDQYAGESEADAAAEAEQSAYPR